MWPSARSIFLAALAATAVTAELSFVASVQQDGHEDVDAAALLKFVPIPPSRHRKHASPSRHGDSRAGRDLVSYSANWCGASQHVPQSEEISSVIGYFTVPDLTLRPTSPAPQFAAAWVGIDGAQCNTTLLQAGVTTIVGLPGVGGRACGRRRLICGRSTRTAARARRHGGSGIRKRPTISRA